MDDLWPAQPELFTDPMLVGWWVGRGRQDGFGGVRGRFGGTDGPLSPMAWKVGPRGELSAGSFPQHE